MNRSSESFGNSDDSNVIQRESGLYVYNNNKHTTPPSEQSPQIEPQVSSQNEINLDDYEEVLVPSKEEAIKRFQETGEISPTIISVVKKDKGTIENTDPVVTQTETPPTPNIPPKPESPAIESKSNEDEMKRLNDSLRKAREENPLEAVQNTLRRQESQRQQAFAREVENERISNDPTYKKKVLSETETSETVENTVEETAEQEKMSDEQLRIKQLEEDVRVLKEMLKKKDDGEWIEGPEYKKPERPDTSEELLTKLDLQIKELEEKEKNGPLTYEEYLKHRDLRLQRNEIHKGLQEKEQAEKEKRERKNKWIKIIAGIAGAGIAMATPAVSVAALIGITIGGRSIGKGLNKWGESLRNKSRDLRYQVKDGMTQEQIEDIEKRQRRNAWWGERLTETSSVLIGGSTGYGLGKAVQGIISSIQSAQQANNMPKADSSGGENIENVNNTSTTTENPIDASGENIVKADVDIPSNTTTESISQTEGWLGDKSSWDVSKYGWDPAKYGWRGTNLQLEGSVNADLQKTLLQTIESKVPEEVFFKAGAQDAFQRALSSIYSQGSQSVGTVADRLTQELLSLLGN